MEKIKQHPLIIVFYLDAEMMKVKDIIIPFSEAINKMLIAKDVNALAFFIPTNGEERVECINPVIVNETDMDKIMVILEDIKKSFDIGAEIDVSYNEITPEEKPCECGLNPGENCKCDK